MPSKRNGSAIQSGRASKNPKIHHGPASDMATVSAVADNSVMLENKKLQDELARLKAEFEMLVNKRKADKQEIETLQKKIASLKKTRTKLEAEVEEVDAARAKAKASNKLLKELVDAHRANRQKNKLKRKDEMADIQSAVVDVIDTLHLALEKHQVTTSAKSDIWYNKGYAAAGEDVSYSDRKDAQDALDSAIDEENKYWKRIRRYMEELMEMTN